tara:strand:- start:1581 stop:2366 length:786 start_codon:yes stop_codon:yes gene_type:complete
MNRIAKWSAVLLALAFAALPLAASRADDNVTLVFAAASLTDVLTTVGADYQAATGKKVTFSFAGSSVLARQIEASSPASMFISADEDWMDYLSVRGLIDGPTRSDLLSNRLVLIAPATSEAELPIVEGFPLLAALKGGRLAVADPDTVPAGKYARTALTSLGVWSSVVDHLAQAENVRVALAYVARGETPFGIVYETDALSQPKVRIVDVFPATAHQPITYPVALLKTADPDAAGFLAYLKSDAAQAVFIKAGFIISAEGH